MLQTTFMFVLTTHSYIYCVKKSNKGCPKFTFKSIRCQSEVLALEWGTKFTPNIHEQENRA